MVLDRIITFLLLYSLAATPTSGLSQKKSNPLEIRAYNTIMKKVSFGNTLEQQIKESYANEIVHPGTDRIVDPNNALGKPDEKYALITPHGELTLRMEKPFPAMQAYNDGRVVIKEGSGEFSLAALVPVLETDPEYGVIMSQSDQGLLKHVWREIVPGLINGGFQIPPSEQSLVDTLKIKNVSEKNVYIDAVISYGH